MSNKADALKIAIVLFILLLTGCVSMIGERTVHISSAQIQEKLNERLALPFSLLKVFDVRLSNARVTFNETTERMYTTINADLTNTILDQTLSGQLSLSGKLRFDAASSSIVLDEAAMEKLSFSQANQQLNAVLNALGKTVGKEILTGLTLYKVKPEALKLGNTQYMPQKILVTARGLQIQLAPQ
jgi:hypothetical protein